MSFILIHVTHSNLDDAKNISTKLLEKRMVASVNYIPIESSYRWKENISH